MARILIVDDDENVVEIVAWALKNQDHAVLVAYNGHEAIDQLHMQRPDLVILDILMPRESGIRLYRNLKTTESLKHIPVVVLSGIAEKSFQRSQKALTEFGGETVPEPEAYLEKPVKAEVLADTIKRVIG